MSSKQNRFKGDKYYIKNAHEKLTGILGLYDQIVNSYLYLTTRLEELEGAQQDMLHYIEFADLDIQKGFKAYKKLQKIRIERRLVKDELEGMGVAYQAVKNIKDPLYHLRKAQIECHKITKNKKQENRTYTERCNFETGIKNMAEKQEEYSNKLKEMVVIS